MTRLFLVRTFTTLALMLGLSVGLAQSARTNAMAGVELAGYAGGTTNPASIAWQGDDAVGTSLSLPVGALNYLTSAWADPLNAQFDVLSFLAQVYELDQYLLLVPSSPEAWTLAIDGDGVNLTQTGGTTVVFPEAFGFGQRIDVPIRFRIGDSGFEAGVRPYVDLGLNGTLSNDSTFDSSTAALEATVTGSGRADAGVAAEVAYATQLEDGAVEGIENLTLGARLHVLVGLAHASASATGTGSGAFSLDGSSSTEADASYEADLFLAGLLTGSVGFGGAVDLGLIGTVPTDAGDVTVELAVEQLGGMYWMGETTTIEGTLSDMDTSAAVAGTKTLLTPFGVRLAAALALSPEVLGVEGDLAANLRPVLGGDIAYHVNDGITGGVAGEIGLYDAIIRVGAGYDAGWRAGLGVGYDVGPVGIDISVAGQQAPFTNTFSLGVGASLRVFVGGE